MTQEPNRQGDDIKNKLAWLLFEEVGDGLSQDSPFSLFEYMAEKVLVELGLSNPPTE